MKKISMMVVVLFAMVSAPFAMADDLAEAKKLVETNVIKSYKELSSPSISNEKRIELAIALMDEYVSFPAVSRLAVGNYWRQMTTEQQGEYEDLFEKWLKFSMSTRLVSLDYTKESSISIVNSYQTNRTSVITTETVSGGNTITLQWHLRRFRDGIKVIDVVVEDISMVQAQRAEFSAVIISKGIDGFLDTLRNMVTEIAL